MLFEKPSLADESFLVFVRETSRAPFSHLIHPQKLTLRAAIKAKSATVDHNFQSNLSRTDVRRMCRWSPLTSIPVV